MDNLHFTVLDVFTQTPYEGNPLALVKIPHHQRAALTQERKQRIARQFNLSETVFLHEKEGLEQQWTIDIFTTNDELPFAGHPTIGAAFYVLNLESENAHTLGSGTMLTKAGPIPITLLGESMEDQEVCADIPHLFHIHEHTIGDLEQPIPGLSTIPKLMKAEMSAPIVSIVKGMTFLLIQLPNLQMLSVVQSTHRDLSFHGLLDPEFQTGFVAKYYYVLDTEERPNGDDVIRIRTRMLEISMEDPATGSAACALSCYLALKFGQSKKFEVIQGVEMGQKSVIGVDVGLNETRDGIKSVRLRGSAVRIMEGVLRV